MVRRSSSSHLRIVHHQGFTLVEMLVVVGIIAMLVGLVVPVMASFRAETKSTACLSNLRQLFLALDASRQQHKDMLPYAAPLPVATGQVALLPGLPKRLEKIIPERSETWLCPGDTTQDSQDIGTSYFYAPGAFMLAQPPLLVEPPAAPLTLQGAIDRAVKLVMRDYTQGYLRGFPVLFDSDEYHRYGGREPWNAVFLDGTTRVAKRSDGKILMSHESPLPQSQSSNPLSPGNSTQP